MSKKKDTKKNAQIQEMSGIFQIDIDAFGIVQSSIDIDKVNDYLNEQTTDKKLKKERKLEKEEE